MESLLVEAVNYQGPEMPPAGKLAPEKIEILARWVSLGAPWPSRDRTTAHAAPTDGQRMGTDLRGDKTPLWSLRPLHRPEVPEVGNLSPGEESHWSTHPIDRFIYRKLADRGLSPAPAADRWTLIRRVTFDLTGLPPTPGEVAAFPSRMSGRTPMSGSSTG